MLNRACTRFRAEVEVPSDRVLGPLVARSTPAAPAR